MSKFFLSLKPLLMQFAPAVSTMAAIVEATTCYTFATDAQFIKGKNRGVFTGPPPYPVIM